LELIADHIPNYTLAKQEKRDVAELKTKQTEESVEKFLKAIEDENRRKDCFTVAELMEEVTGLKPKMWGPSIVGFGSYHYKYASGQESDCPIAAFSPRKQNLTLYIMPGFINMMN
jgi:hypothetical protein